MTSNTDTEMVTREIPPGEWKDFFDEFTRRHEGWLVTVEIFGEMRRAAVSVGRVERQAMSKNRPQRGRDRSAD